MKDPASEMIYSLRKGHNSKAAQPADEPAASLREKHGARRGLSAKPLGVSSRVPATTFVITLDDPDPPPLEEAAIILAQPLAAGRLSAASP